MANFTLRTTYRQGRWRGFFDGFEDPESQAISATRRFVNYQPTFAIWYDTDPSTLVAHTVVSDAYYGHTRVTVVDI